VYIFAVDTTAEQDQAFIDHFNALANKSNFNGVTRNCADFTRGIINFYFPHAVHRDYVNDFGMESPKAVARTFTHFALHHAELNFRVLHFAQVPGTIRRSSEVRAGTEQLVRSKKLLIPMALFADHAIPVVAASYLLTGRFSAEKTFEKYPMAGPDVENATALEQQAAATPEERALIVGTAGEWKGYRKELDATLQAHKDVIDGHDLSRFFQELDRAGTASVEDDGSLWMQVSDNGEPLKVGLSANNALALGSNPRLAFKFLLARTRGELKSPKHGRETMPEFEEDWARLRQASGEGDTSLSLAKNAGVGKAAGYR
jgi:hypothetical protein